MLPTKINYNDTTLIRQASECLNRIRKKRNAHKTSGPSILCRSDSMYSFLHIAFYNMCYILLALVLGQTFVILLAVDQLL